MPQDQLLQDVDFDENCPHCQIEDADIIAQDDYGVIIYDRTPVTKGHALVMPRRHVASFFEVSDKERKSLIALIEQARNELEIIYHPNGFHVSFADGNVSGQPIEHLHIHIIPRYAGQALKLDQRWGVMVVEEEPDLEKV